MTSVNTQSSSFSRGWVPVATTVTASVAYTANNAFLLCIRSNAGSAMTDTLPNPLTPVSDGSENILIQNGWNIIIMNNDASATLTITPASPATINGATAIVLTAGNAVKIYCDGTNYFTSNEYLASVAPTTSAGTSVAYSYTSMGRVYYRSNATVAMTDTLPNAATLPLDWSVTIINTDASASDTITPTTSKINGATTLVIAAGAWAKIYSNGTDYFAIT